MHEKERLEKELENLKEDVPNWVNNKEPSEAEEQVYEMTLEQSVMSEINKAEIICRRQHLIQK